MKKFEKPEFEIVRFNKKDIIATSLCGCVDCRECPAGKDNCQCVDFVYANE